MWRNETEHGKWTRNRAISMAIEHRKWRKEQSIAYEHSIHGYAALSTVYVQKGNRAPQVEKRTEQ